MAECTCKKIELPNQARNAKVKAYATDGSCDYCKVRAVEREVEMERDKRQQDAAMLISARAQKAACDALLAEGKIQLVDGVPETIEA